MCLGAQVKRKSSLLTQTGTATLNIHDTIIHDGLTINTIILMAILSRSYLNHKYSYGNIIKKLSKSLKTKHIFEYLEWSCSNNWLELHVNASTAVYNLFQPPPVKAVPISAP